MQLLLGVGPQWVMTLHSVIHVNTLVRPQLAQDKTAILLMSVWVAYLCKIIMGVPYKLTKGLSAR